MRCDLGFHWACQAVRQRCGVTINQAVVWWGKLWWGKLWWGKLCAHVGTSLTQMHERVQQVRWERVSECSVGVCMGTPCLLLCSCHRHLRGRRRMGKRRGWRGEKAKMGRWGKGRVVRSVAGAVKRSGVGEGRWAREDGEGRWGGEMGRGDGEGRWGGEMGRGDGEGRCGKCKWGEVQQGQSSPPLLSRPLLPFPPHILSSTTPFGHHGWVDPALGMLPHSTVGARNTTGTEEA
ncbi:unnamed protein product [Closterium sp. NIES-65]|nr:unnamed protein product [Closterium sp. NIES-65]